MNQSDDTMAPAPGQGDKTDRLPVRSDADYAIEHGEYLATAAEGFMAAHNRLAAYYDEDAPDPVDVANAEVSLSERFGGLSSAIYEFRKRAERAKRTEVLHEQAANAAQGKAGSTPAQSQRSGETGGRFDSGEGSSGETKARPASVVSAAAESAAQSEDQSAIGRSDTNGGGAHG